MKKGAICLYKDEINKNDLKVGDVVGVRRPTQIGWGYFRYPKMYADEITRITPARTKFVTKRFGDIHKSEPLYKITPESNEQTLVAFCARDIVAHLQKLDKIRSSDGLNSLSDQAITEIAKLLSQCVEEMEDDLTKGSE